MVLVQIAHVVSKHVSPNNPYTEALLHVYDDDDDEDVKEFDSPMHQHTQMLRLDRSIHDT